MTNVNINIWVSDIFLSYNEAMRKNEKIKEQIGWLKVILAYYQQF